MALPSVQEAISFVVFFLPGLVTLVSFSLLSGIEIKQWLDIKRIIFCAVFSALSFMFAGVSLNPEQIVASIFTPNSFLTVIGVSLGLGVLSGLFSIGWLYVSKHLALFAQLVSGKTGISYASYQETCLTNFLRKVLQSNREVIVTVSTTSGGSFKGLLGGYGTNPVEVVLMAQQGNPIRRLSGGNWVDIDDYLLIIRDKDILAVSLAET